MSKIKKNTQHDFDHILLLIQEARSRTYSKANTELVMLYFNVGKIVSDKVAAGAWGEGTVNELAAFIQEKQPCLSGFTRRGLYRMRQFYDTYTAPQFVSALMTQLQRTENELLEFVSSVLIQINWTNHCLILSKTKSAEEKLYYLLTVIKEKYSTREFTLVGILTH